MSNPIKIQPKTIVGGNASYSFDGNLNTGWFPGWNPKDYPAKALVSFDKEYEFSSLKIYDNSGTPTFRVYKTDSTGKIGTKLVEIDLIYYKTWREILFQNVKGQYFVIEIDGIQGDNVIPEIEFYGYSSTENPPPIDPIPNPTPITGSLSGEALKINLCGFHWVPLDKLTSFSSIRLYMSSGWMWRPNGLFVEPLYQAAKPGQAPGLDTYFQKCKDQGLEPIPTINQTPEWYRLSGQTTSIFKSDSQNPDWFNNEFMIGDGSNDFPPIKPGLDRKNPQSYKDWGDFLFQFSARYGSKTWPDSALRIDTTKRWDGDIPNQKKSGLGLIHFIEVWNEADKWWKKGTEIYMEPEELSAMMTISYQRIKEADPNIKVIMPGLTGFDYNYFQRFVTQCKVLNNGKLPFDIINLHHYSNLGNELGKWPPTWYPGLGCAPEVDKDFVGVLPFIKFGKENNLKVWVSEFGYDTQIGNPKSWMYPKDVPNQSAEETQSQWLLRTYLEYIRLGVDNCFLFNAIDEPGWQSGGLYQSSGILKAENQNYQEKPAYSNLKSIIQILNTLVYCGDLSLKDVRILGFKNDSKTVLAYWLPTDSAKTKSFKIFNQEFIAKESIQFLEIR